MPIAREKSQNFSMRQRVDMRVAAQVNLEESEPISTEQIAEGFCEEMIENLKRNVAESKHRSPQEILDESAALHAESAEILQEIWGLQ
jgi:hypothetical protein